MSDKATHSPAQFGGWSDAEELRKWSFLQRTPQQRLDWLVQALGIAYQTGAVKPVLPGLGANEGSETGRADSRLQIR
jgi:hypothetical protein